MENMLNELPPTLKEEVFFNQYGSLIERLEFFRLLRSYECKWRFVKEMSKLEYNRGDKIYDDGEFADSIYLIYKGAVRLYAENDYPFMVFRSGNTFGDIDIFCGTRRNGTAITSEDCLFYRVHKNKIDDIMFDFPEIRDHIVQYLLNQNKIITKQRLKVITKNPVLGINGTNLDQHKRAIRQIKMLKKQFNDLNHQESSQVESQPPM